MPYKGDTLMKRSAAAGVALCLLLCTPPGLAVETGLYRLLSISTSEKLILVSQIPGKTKYLLDTASAKITINGKAAEFSEIKNFAVIQLKFELKKIKRNGIDIDGAAAEIRITTTEDSE